MPHAPPGVSLSTEDDNDVDNGEQKSRGAEIEHSSLLIICALDIFSISLNLFAPRSRRSLHFLLIV